MINFGVETRRNEERRQGIYVFTIVDQQGSQEQLKEAAINHATPGNGLICASPKIQEAQ